MGPKHANICISYYLSKSILKVFSECCIYSLSPKINIVINKNSTCTTIPIGIHTYEYNTYNSVQLM